jgi:hypothetical protein
MTVCKFDSKGLKLQEKIIPVNACYLFLLLVLFFQWLAHFLAMASLLTCHFHNISRNARDILNYLYWKPEHSHCCFSCHIQHNIPFLLPALLLITLLLSGNSKINLVSKCWKQYSSVFLAQNFFVLIYVMKSFLFSSELTSSHEKYILHIKLEGCGVIKYKYEFLYFPCHSDETETHWIKAVRSLF